MAVVNLRAREVVALEEVLRATDDARQFTRAQALLWLDAGESVEEVAERLGVTRQAVYKWGVRFSARSALDCAGRVADGPRSGRPRTALGIIEPLLEQVLATDPGTVGMGRPCGRPHCSRTTWRGSISAPSAPKVFSGR